MPTFQVLQKGDLAATSFANTGTNAAGGVTVRTDAGSTVKVAIDAAILAAGTGGTVSAATDTVAGKVALAVQANYPSTSDVDATTPAYVAAAVAASAVPVATSVTAGKALLAIASGYPSGSDATATTPAYVTAAVSAAVTAAMATFTIPLVGNDGTTTIGYAKAP